MACMKLKSREIVWGLQRKVTFIWFFYFVNHMQGGGGGYIKKNLDRGPLEDYPARG